MEINVSIPYPTFTYCAQFHFLQVAAFHEKIQSCREMLEKIPGVDTNVEKQKRELEFYQNKYKEKWYSRHMAVLIFKIMIGSNHFSMPSFII